MVAWGGAHPVTARVVVSVTLLLAVPAWWHHPAVAVLTRYVYVCFGPGTLHSTGPPLVIRYHALPSHPSFVWTLCCHPRRCRNRVYVSYWYYKRPDIPSGVRRRPSGRDKTGGELFFSTHLDENKVQTLMGHCKVYDRPVWLDRGSKTAPMHTYYCSKVYDLQGQYVRGFCVGVVGGGGCSPLSHGCAPCSLFFFLSSGFGLNDRRVSLVLSVGWLSRGHRCTMVGTTVTDAFVHGVVCCSRLSLHPPPCRCVWLLFSFICSWLPPPLTLRMVIVCVRPAMLATFVAQARRRC